MVENKIGVQSRATEKYYERLFVEMKKLDEKSKEAPLLVQRKQILENCQDERDAARRLINFGCSHETSGSSVVDRWEEVSQEFPQNEREATKEKGEWRLEPQRDTEMLEVKVVSDVVRGVPVNPDGEGHHEARAIEKSQKGMRGVRRKMM